MLVRCCGSGFVADNGGGGGGGDDDDIGGGDKTGLQPIGSSNMTFHDVYSSKYISVLYSKINNNMNTLV